MQYHLQLQLPATTTTTDSPKNCFKTQETIYGLYV